MSDYFKPNKHQLTWHNKVENETMKHIKVSRSAIRKAVRLIIKEYELVIE